jgi:aminopeptidase N
MLHPARPLAALLLGLLAACGAPREAAYGALVPLPVPPVRLRPPVVDVTHYDIRVDIDHRAGLVDGSITVEFRALPDRPATELLLDAVELQVAGAWDESGNELAWELRDHVLRVSLTEPVPPGGAGNVSIDWRCWPRRGLYVVGPSAAEPGRPWHVWTQGQTHEARHWLPVWDQPDDRATHTLAVTVDDSFTTMAAGERVGSRLDERTGRRTDTWALEVPHPAYLITLVAGQLEERELPSAGQPLPVLADPAAQDAAQANLAATDDALAFLANWTGRPYPYPKYAQCLVRDFTAGGQENISATTLMHETLHAPQDGPQEDLRTEDLVVHEAAHQWFGDLVTCRDWSHLWLNEGFATYAELLWAREARGEDAARAMALRWQRQMTDAERDESLPIEWPGYPEPDALFDTHRYEGAATRLHLLAAELGDDVLRRGVQLYLRRHEAGCVVTDDLRAALEEASGKDLAGFFGQWIAGRGFPIVRVRVADNGSAPRLLVRQVRPDGAPGRPFRLPAHVAWSRGGVEHEAPLTLEGPTADLVLAGEGPLDWTRFDSRTVMPGEIDHLQREDQWRSQLLGARDGVTRLVAAQWFARDPYVDLAGAGTDALQPESLAALEHAARGDAFLDVRTTALLALAARAPASHAPTALALRELAADPDARVRAAAAEALGAHGGDETLPVLLELAGDANAEVCAGALRSLVARGFPGAFGLGRKLLESADPLRWRLRESLVQSLARVPGEPALAPLLVATTRTDPTPRVRATAVHLLRGRGDPPPDVRFRLAAELLWDGSHVVRAAAATLLGDWPDAQSGPLLEARRSIEIDPDVLAALDAALDGTW